MTLLSPTRAAVAAHLTPATAAAAALSRDPFARAHGRAALRFQLSLALYLAAIVGLMHLASGTLAGRVKRGRMTSTQSTPTAREIRRITMLSEMNICIMARIFAQRASSGASVGPKVELWVNATKR